MLNRVGEWKNNVNCKHDSGGFLIAGREKEKNTIGENRIMDFGFLHADTCAWIICATTTGVMRCTLFLLSFKVNSIHAFT